MTNEELFQKLQDGCKAARDTLILQNQPLVMVALKRYPIYKDSVNSFEDMVSIGTIGLIKAVDSFNTSKKIAFSTYAMKCILNELFQRFRRMQKEIEVISLESFVDAIPDSRMPMEEDVENRDMIFCAVRAIKELDPRQKKAITMALQGDGDIKQSQIGAAIGISQSAASRLIRRTQRQLCKVCEYNQ